MAVRRLDRGAHLPQRLGDALHRPRRERLVAGQLEASALARRATPASSRISVPGVRRSRPCPTRSPRRPTPCTTSSSSATSSTSTPSARTASIVDCVSPERPKPVHVRLALAERAEQHGAVRDRLVAGHGDVPDELHRRLDLHSADRAAHEGRERADLRGELREVGRSGSAAPRRRAPPRAAGAPRR